MLLWIEFLVKSRECSIEMLEIETSFETSSKYEIMVFSNSIFKHMVQSLFPNWIS